MWHSVGECQPINFRDAKTIFLFQILYSVAKKNVVYIFSLRIRKTPIASTHSDKLQLSTPSDVNLVLRVTAV